MQPAPSSEVRGLAGLRGTVLTTSRPPGDSSTQVAVKLSDGQIVVVPEKELVLQSDNSYFLALSPADVGGRVAAATAALSATDARVSASTTSATTSTGTAAASAQPAWAGQTLRAGDEVRIPRVEERFSVGKAQEQSAVRVRKTVHEREEVVDVPLLREQVDVERVAVNRVVEAAPEVRHEGDVMVIPVLEEVLVVEKRLMLREELRVTRRRDQVHEPQRVTLRSEQVEVTREAMAGQGATTGPPPAAAGVK